MGLLNMRALLKSHTHTDTWSTAPLKHNYNTPEIKNCTQHLGVKKAAMGDFACMSRLPKRTGFVKDWSYWASPL